MTTNYYKEIDGLRALAVLSVLIFHAFPSILPGGFVGVDIFFVISGFLITRIISKEFKKGSFSFVDFFSRRILRLYPALILVLVSTIVFGYIALLPDELVSLAWNSFAGSLFFSNIYQWQESLGYFEKASELNPLMHLWSLSVEEQYYLFFPFFISLLFLKKIRIEFAVLLVLTFSLFFNIYTYEKNTVLNFFSPLARFWEMAIGGILSFLYEKAHTFSLQKRLDSIISKLIYSDGRIENRISSEITFLVSIILVFYSLIFINGSVRYPGYQALIPVVAAVGIIASAASSRIGGLLLGNQISIFLGKISYPLYLWHWPVLSYLYIINSGTPHRDTRILALIFSAMAAWITYEIVEKNIRFKNKSRIYVFSLLFFMSGITILSYYIIEKKGFFSYQKNFIALNKDLHSQIGSKAPLENSNCRDRYQNFDQGLCILEHKDTPPTIALIGDSHAHHFYEGLRNNILLNNENLLMLGAGWGGKHLGALNFFTEQGLFPKILDLIKREPKIEKVLISHLFNNNLNFEQYEGLFKKLSETNKKIYYIVDIPVITIDSKKCFPSRPYTYKEESKHSCDVQGSESDSIQKKYLETIRKVAMKFDNVIFISPKEILCTNGICKQIINNKLLYSNHGNNTHLSIDGSIYVSDFIANKVVN